MVDVLGLGAHLGVAAPAILRIGNDLHGGHAGCASPGTALVIVRGAFGKVPVPVHVLIPHGGAEYAVAEKRVPQADGLEQMLSLIHI